MPDKSGAIDLGNLPKPQPGEGPQDSAPKPIPVTTAFLVVIKDGQIGLEKNINAPLVLARQPTDDDVYAALSTALNKLTVGQTAAVVVQNMVAASQQAMQQAQETQLRQAVLNGQVPIPGQPR